MDFSQLEASSDAFQGGQIIFPTPMVSGDTWVFQISSDTIDPTVTASITFAAGITKLSAVATLSGGFFNWSIPGSQTALLSPQPYLYNISVTDLLGNRTTIQRGAAIVSADISAPGAPVANLTNLQMMLQACDQTLIALMGQTTSMVMFQGQEYHFWDIDKLFQVRTYLAVQVANEQAVLEGNKKGRRIITVFTNQ